MSSSSGYPARWAAGRGWLGRALGSLLAGVRLRPRGSSAAQLSCPAQLPSLAGQLGWPAFLASLAGWFGARRTPSESAGVFFWGLWTGISFFPFSLVWGCNLFLGKKLRSETQSQPSRQPSWPAELPAKLASQAGLPSWPAKLGQVAGSWITGWRAARATQPEGQPARARYPAGWPLPTHGPLATLWGEPSYLNTHS